VRIDGDATGREIVSRLRDQYPSWSPDRFATFSEAHFEPYYPAAFAEEINAALGQADRRSRRDAKRDLLVVVRAWLDEDPERGREALSDSAASVITDLHQMEAALATPTTIRSGEGPLDVTTEA
jgi:hypothetical protein